MIACIDYYNGICNSLTHMCKDCPDRKDKKMMEDHYYTPDYQAMGDCRVCGHDEDKAWHINRNKYSTLGAKEMKHLSFDELRYFNVQRNKEWDVSGQITASFRGLELAGEVGELCNNIKKLERERMGMKGSRTSVRALALEIGDALITLDLVAMHYGIDVAEAVKTVFNAKSDEHGFLTRIE